MTNRAVSQDSTEYETTDKTVLFVDDDRDLLEVYDVMYSDDYNVLTADSGQKALQMFGDHIDFAFLDRRMPNMSGDALLRRIRERGYATSVGFLSAVDAEEDIEADYDVYISKPAGKDQVSTAIEQYTT